MEAAGRRSATSAPTLPAAVRPGLWSGQAAVTTVSAAAAAAAAGARAGAGRGMRREPAGSAAAAAPPSMAAAADLQIPGSRFITMGKLPK